MDKIHELIDTNGNGIPLFTFYQITLNNTQEGITSCVFLTNRPMMGIKADISEESINLGSMGTLRFLAIAKSYKIGYLIEVSSLIAEVNPLYLFVGQKTEEINKIKNVEILYADSYINLIRCKSTNSYLIVPVCNLEFPKVIPLSTVLEELDHDGL